jgi:hypothetical protein
MQQQQIHFTKLITVQNEHLFTTTVSFVRAAGVLAKGRIFDMPALQNRKECIMWRLRPSVCLWSGIRNETVFQILIRYQIWFVVYVEKLLRKHEVHGNCLCDDRTLCKGINEYLYILYVFMYSGPSSYNRPDIRTTWVTTKVLSYDPNAGQGQNVYPLVRL